MQDDQVNMEGALLGEWTEGMERGHVLNARRAFERLELKAGQRYLDIGCGSGYSVRWAAAVDPSVMAVGLDSCEKTIARARQLSSDLANARFILAEFPVPELRAHAFDAIFSMDVFAGLQNLVWAVQNVARLLKQGGLFACTMDYYRDNTASPSGPPGTGVEMHLLSEGEWRQLMEGIGLEVVEQTRLKVPLAEGEVAGREHTVGSLMILVRRPTLPLAA